MQLGMVGLGKMGANMTTRLVRGGHDVVAFDRTADAVKAATTNGARGANTLEDLVKQLAAPRAVWIMVPAGDPTENTVRALADLLASGDTIIDGGNSNYKESIRRSAHQRGRHKKQSGGHGQYGDVVIEIRPLERGEGFRFEDKITGGAIPKQWIPAVDQGVRDAMEKGPLGFPVVDLAVTLTDGSYHTVDSSDAAFQAAARLAMSEALPKAKPVLLEPILAVEIAIPSEALSKASALVTGRRGQILGFDTRDGWAGWDSVKAMMPETEIGDLIIEIRSATAGVGTFTAKFDHMAELTGRTADQIVAAKKAAQAAA